MKKSISTLFLFSALAVFCLKAQNNTHAQKILSNSTLVKQATLDDYKNIIKLKTGAQPSMINKSSIAKSSASKTFYNPISNYMASILATAPECDTLLAQWETPTPTVTTYGFGGGWVSGIPDPVNSTLPTDPKGIYEGYNSPNPGTAVVGGIRVGLGTLHDLDSNTTFQVVVYDDDGFGAPGAFLGGLGGLNPTTLGVPGSGLYTDFWIPLTTTIIPTTAFFHVGVEIIPGDGSDSLVVMTSCLGPANCTVAQGENDASNHIFTTGFGYENFLTIYGADFDVDIIPTFGEYAIFNYSAASYCKSATNETPSFLGATGGAFSSTPTGLSLNATTGEITFSTSTAGTYTITYTAPGTCAKTTTAALTVKATATKTTNTNVCFNSSFTYADLTTSNNITANESHVSTFIGAAANGCDSVLTQNLNVLPAKTGSVTSTICNNGSVVVNGNTYNAGNPSGTEVISNVGPSNCDSTVTINLNVLSAKTGSVTSTICNNGSVVVNGNTYNAGNPSGTEVISNVGPNNCDSTVTINLNVLPAKTGSVTSTICNNGSVVVNGNTYNASNPSGTEVISNVGPNNCDSIVTVNLNVLPAKTGSVTSTICNNGSVVVNGTTYNASNPSGTEVISNVGPNNCDSTVIVNLNVLAVKTGSVTSTICNNGSVVVNGTTYNASNPSGTEVISNVGPNNCDSTVTINLNVLAVKTGAVTSTICNNGSVVVNGTTYNAGNPSGTEVISNVGPSNCDSTVTINLTILPALTGTITQTICFGESIVVNGTTYNTTVSGATEVFTNIGPNNCDSTVTINLTVLSAIDNSLTNNNPTLTANETGAAYQWLDCDNGNAVINGETSQSFTATVTGNYAVQITVGSCVDTSACENVTVVGIDELSKASVNVYPNPNDGVFNVITSEQVNITIYNMLGEIVLTNVLNGGTHVLSLNSHPKGVYFVNIQQNERVTTYKMIVK